MPSPNLIIQGRTLINGLSISGIIYYYEQNHNLSQYIILDPQWATKAIHRLLNNSIIRDKYGKFNISDAEIVWDEDKYKGIEQQLFLELMVEFQFCFLYKDRDSTLSEKIYIIPELLAPEEKPEIDWDDVDNIRLKFQYQLVPIGIIGKFMAMKHRYIENGLFWKCGVVLKIKESRVLVVSSPKDKEIKISISGKDKWESIEEIIKDFRHNNEMLPNNLPKEYIACTCNKCSYSNDPYYFDFIKEKHDFRTNKTNYAQCGKSRELIQLSNILGGKSNSNDEDVRPSVDERPLKKWKTIGIIVLGIIILAIGFAPSVYFRATGMWNELSQKRHLYCTAWAISSIFISCKLVIKKEWLAGFENMIKYVAWGAGIATFITNNFQ